MQRRRRTHRYCCGAAASCGGPRWPRSVFAGGRQCYTDYAYPALLDPGCPTDSYDELGETAYLHLLGDAGWHTANLTTTRDIIRIKLQFSK